MNTDKPYTRQEIFKILLQYSKYLYNQNFNYKGLSKDPNSRRKPILIGAGKYLVVTERDIRDGRKKGWTSKSGAELPTVWRINKEFGSFPEMQDLCFNAAGKSRKRYEISDVEAAYLSAMYEKIKSKRKLPDKSARHVLDQIMRSGIVRPVTSQEYKSYYEKMKLEGLGDELMSFSSIKQVLSRERIKLSDFIFQLTGMRPQKVNITRPALTEEEILSIFKRRYFLIGRLPSVVDMKKSFLGTVEGKEVRLPAIYYGEINQVFKLGYVELLANFERDQGQQLEFTMSELSAYELSIRDTLKNSKRIPWNSMPREIREFVKDPKRFKAKIFLDHYNLTGDISSVWGKERPGLKKLTKNNIFSSFSNSLLIFYGYVEKEFGIELKFSNLNSSKLLDEAKRKNLDPEALPIRIKERLLASRTHGDLTH